MVLNAFHQIILSKNDLRLSCYSEKIINISEIYRNIYLRGLNISQAATLIEKEFPDSEEKKEILKFIKESSRGILKVSSKEIKDEN